MWLSEMDDSRHEREKIKQPRYKNDEFRISNAIKAALKIEVEQWITNFMPQVSKSTVSTVENYLGTALYHFERSINGFREDRFPPNLTGDNCP